MERRTATGERGGGGGWGGGWVGALPAAGLALFVCGAGTLAGGATAAGATAGVVLVLVAAVAAGPRWRDPLALGRPALLLPWALWAAVVASAWASPVPRAGLLPALLLPAYLLLPAAVARAWERRSARDVGVGALAVLATAVALWSLAGRFLGGDPRAAAPLGHHLLLGVVLLALWPATVLAAARGRWPFRLAWWGGVPVAALAILSTGSLAVWTGGAAQLAALAVLSELPGTERPTLGSGAPKNRVFLGRGVWDRPLVKRPGFRRTSRYLVVGTLVALAALLVSLALPRLEAILGGTDPSTRARVVYLRAGLGGIADRPWLGHGPGSVPWTLGEHLRPEPAVDPPGEMVAELHLLPLQLAYEIGLPATALAAVLGWIFARRVRRRSLHAVGVRAAAGGDGGGDRGFVRLGGLGLLGAGVACLATGWWGVTALPATLAVCCGALLAGSICSGAGGGAEVSAGRSGWPAYLPASLYALAAALALAPVLRAQWAYDRAARLGEPRAVELALAGAAAGDPGFPWYRLLAALPAPAGRPDAAAVRELREAAEGGHAIAPLWLAAGVYGGAAGEPWAAAALERACRLDPLGALAPFYRLALEPRAELARSAGARALLAEPRLGAATFWDEHPGLLAAALDGVRSASGVDPGWREELVARVAVRPGGGGKGERVELGLQLDPAAAESVPLRVFRRRRWSLVLVPVTLSAAALERLDLPPASTLATTDAAVFATAGCALGHPPG